MALLISLVGCERNEIPEKHLEDYFQFSISYEIRANTYYAGATPRHDRDVDVIKRKIIEFLEQKPDALPTNYPDISNESEPILRQRDFWALVLARLDGKTLEITRSSSYFVRDQNIAELLASVKH